MFVHQVASAIADARTLTRLDHLARHLWQAWSGGACTDTEVQMLSESLEAQKRSVRGDIVPVGIPPGRPTIFPPRRLQRPPDRAVAIERRRHLAASGPMPPALAARFTVAEMAALRIVSDEVLSGGQCDRSVAEIAARAGCGRTSVQNAIRQAARLGLLTVEERRREGRKNLPNVIRLVSREWLAWLAKRPKDPAQSRHRVQNSEPHGHQDQKRGFREGASGSGRALPETARWLRGRAAPQTGSQEGSAWRRMDR